MNSNHPAFQQFLKTWTAEFGRAIQMSTGQQPSLSFSEADNVSIPKTASALWLKQVFSAESEFQIWVGTQEATWMQFGKTLPEDAPDDVRSTFIEIVDQALKGAARVASLGLPVPIQCGTLENSPTPSFDPASFFVCEVELIGTEHPPIVIALEQTALEVLGTAAKSNANKETPGSAVKKIETSAFRRMADLSLPVSISVGGARLEIAKVLNARAGSVISLAKDVSEPVELLVDGVIVARGELVVVKGNYGFRVKQIVTQSQRVSLYNH
ncbi:MAG: FliM/FliN family flagellar motor switch protein [Bryobacteraceae bacterium]